MLRRLLACLALLTGLAAAGVPAQADVVAALSARVEASAAGVARSGGQIQRAISRPAFTRPVVHRQRIELARVGGPLVPAVRLHSDRARE